MSRTTLALLAGFCAGAVGGFTAGCLVATAVLTKPIQWPRELTQAVE